MENWLTRKLIETRNLLAEKDMYHLFEFTSLRAVSRAIEVQYSLWARGLVTSR